MFSYVFPKRTSSFLGPANAGLNAITPSIFLGYLNFKVIDAQAPAECPASTIL